MNQTRLEDIRQLVCWRRPLGKCGRISVVNISRSGFPVDRMMIICSTTEKFIYLQYE